MLKRTPGQSLLPSQKSTWNNPDKNTPGRHNGILPPAGTPYKGNLQSPDNRGKNPQQYQKNTHKNLKEIHK
jgi:hypothetical protein